MKVSESKLPVLRYFSLPASLINRHILRCIKSDAVSGFDGVPAIIRTGHRQNNRCVILLPHQPTRLCIRFHTCSAQNCCIVSDDELVCRPVSIIFQSRRCLRHPCRTIICKQISLPCVRKLQVFVFGMFTLYRSLLLLMHIRGLTNS
jgi:hypothetical protein